jgi:flavin reductase ActVB
VTHTDSTTAEPELFRVVMASFPSGVTIVTTAGADGRWWGFTATSFCSVSVDPPLVLVCLAQTAECHLVFAEAQRWLVHVIPPEHAPLGIGFATRGADKFGAADFEPDENRLPRLAGACITLDCEEQAKLPGGDHTILLGRVRRVHIGDGDPVVFFSRNLHKRPQAL